MMPSRFMFAAVILLLVSSFAKAQSNAQLSPADLVKAVIHSELNPSDVTEVRWKYRLAKEVDGKQETREVVETKSGSLDRLIAIAGRPLSAGQQRDETERILRLSPAQGLNQHGDDDHKQHVLNCAKEIHQPYLKQPDRALSKSITGS